MAGVLRLGCGLVLALCAASVARADPLPLQAELFQREMADARSDTRKTIDSATSDGSTSRPSALISTGEIA